MKRSVETSIVFETSPRRMQGSGVTVAISSYNYESYIRDALESVLRQTHANVELIVVDDRSTDGSLETVRNWMEKEGERFSRARLLRHSKNSGLSQTRNTAFENAANEFIFVLDADNEIYPEAISKLLNASIQTGAEAAYSQLEAFGATSGTGKAADWDPDMLARGNYIDAMALIRKQAWLAAGGYLDFETAGWEDYDLWCKFVELGFKGTFVAEKLCRYRVHASSMVTTISNPNYNKLALEMSRRHPWVRLVVSRPGVAYTMYASKQLVIGTSSRAFFFRPNTNDVKTVNGIFSDAAWDLQSLPGLAEWSAFAERKLQEGSRPLIIDAGANIGASTVYLSSLFPNGTLVAIEPDHKNFQLLSKNVNGLEVETIHGAIASSPGWAAVVDPEIGDWGYTTKPVGDRKLPNSVPQVTIGQLYETHSSGSFPFLVRVDMGGGEEELFSANAEWIDRTPIIMLKNHNGNLPAAFSGLKRISYTVGSHVISCSRSLDRERQGD